ncbi:hypothetical protein KUCAC02_014228, partial [Chaenocephalus aceratus]
PCGISMEQLVARATVGEMERFDLVPACQIPSRSTVSPIHMHTASKQPATMQNTPKEQLLYSNRGWRKGFSRNPSLLSPPSGAVVLVEGDLAG